MKQVSKKAQVYGLSTFLYSIAIAVILIIALIGMSKEFEKKSSSATYRFNAVMAAQAGENIKKILEQERSYAFSEALFVTGAFGGYSIYSDLIPTGNCSIAISAGCNMGTCTGCVAATGMCASGTFPDCIPIKNKKEVTPPCSVKELNIGMIPEKKIPYWRENGKNCTPTVEEVMADAIDFARRFKAVPDGSVLSPLKANSRGVDALMYLMKVNCYPGSRDSDGNYCKNGTVSISWFPWEDKASEVVIKMPASNPTVDYSIPVFINSETYTDFFNLLTSATKMANLESTSEGFNYQLLSPGGILTSTIDKESKYGKYTGGNFTNCSTYANGTSCGSAYCGYGQHSFCQRSSVEGSFQALVRYASTLPSHANEEGLSCPTKLNPSIVSREFNLTTPGNVKMIAVPSSDGRLIINTSVNTPVGPSNIFVISGNHDPEDESAMECVLYRMLENVNQKLTLGNSTSFKPKGDPSVWNIEPTYFAFEYKGANALQKVYYNVTGCGDEGQSCCATAPACLGSLSCNANTICAIPPPCGHAGEACCTTTTPACLGSCDSVTKICTASAEETAQAAAEEAAQAAAQAAAEEAARIAHELAQDIMGHGFI